MIKDTLSKMPYQPKDASELAAWHTFEYIVRRLQTEDNLPDSEVNAFLKDINKIFEVRDFVGDYLEFVGNGAYKECYYAPIRNYIIKFCSEANQTDAEEQILALAEEYNVADFFIPTYFVKLPFKIESCYLDLTTGSFRYLTDERRYTQYSAGYNPMMDAFQIQPHVRTIEWTENTVTYCEDHIENPIKYSDGTSIPFSQVNRSGLGCREWMEAALACYGDNGFNAFLDFCERFMITDLHRKNLGFIEKDGKEYPVVIDWLSNADLH